MPLASYGSKLSSAFLFLTLVPIVLRSAFVEALKMRKSVWLFSLASCGFAKMLNYDWDITWVSVSPDGFRRPAIGINGQWPCPTIRGNVGDEVVVNVNNQLENETTSLHWHGITQNGTPEMDGPS